MALSFGLRLSITPRNASSTSSGLVFRSRISAASSRADLRERSSVIAVAAPLFTGIDNGNDRTAALRTLMHGVNRHKDGGIANRRRGDATYCRFRMTMVMHVGI